MRSRPMVRDWIANVEIGVDLDAFGRNPGSISDADLAGIGDLLCSIMRHGGSKLGLGDYRPEKSGPFGRFQVSSFAIERDS